MKFLLSTVAISAMVLFTVPAFAFGDVNSASTSGAQAGAQSNSNANSQSQSQSQSQASVTTKNLNKNSLAAINAARNSSNTSVNVEGDDYDTPWPTLGGMGAGNNVVASEGNFEGTRNIQIVSPFGGFNIPLTMIDDAAVYMAFVDDVVVTFTRPYSVGNQLRRAFLCENVEGVEDTVENVGLLCPE